MKRLGFIVLCIMVLSSVTMIYGQSLEGVDVLPMGGEYNIQGITTLCETRYNGTVTSRLVAENFILDDDGDLRIGNTERYRQYQGTDEIGVFTSDLSGGPYRTITILSDRTFVQETIWQDDSPCNTIELYNWLRPEPLDVTQIDGITLPHSSAETGVSYNVSRVRDNCAIFPNGIQNYTISHLNFRLQNNGDILVAQFADPNGYANATYYGVTDIPNTYARQTDYYLSIIRLMSPDYFQRQFIYVDGCTVSDTIYLSGEALLALDGDATAETDTDDSQSDIPQTVVLINGVTFDRPAEWDVSAGSDTSQLFMGYRDEELDSYIEMRLLARDGLVFGFEEYDPSQRSIPDLINSYYQANPPAYSADEVTMSDVSMAGLSGKRGELVLDGQSSQFIIFDTGVGGYVGVVINMAVDAQDKWQPFIDEWLATINTDTAFEGAPSFLVELSTGDTFNPETAETEFIDFQYLQLHFTMNGTFGETENVVINPQTPLTSGTYELQDVTMGQQTLGALVNIPMMIDDELYFLNYTTGVNGTLDLMYNGASVSGTFNFTAGFSRFIQGTNINATPENPPEFPSRITVTGSFQNLVPPPNED